MNQVILFLKVIEAVAEDLAIAVVGVEAQASREYFLIIFQILITVLDVYLPTIIVLSIQWPWTWPPQTVLENNPWCFFFTVS